jgi:hypothetical protein
MADEIETNEAVETAELPEVTSLSVDDFAAALAAKRGLVNEQADLEEEAPEVEAETPDIEATPTPEEAAGAEAAADAAEEALPDDATAEEVEEARANAESEFYLGTYRTREEAERGLAEKDALIGRHGQRIDEVTRQLEALQSEREAVNETPEQLDVEAWQEWAEEKIETGAGAQGALQALTEGGNQGYEIYFKAWMRDPDQAADAILFNDALKLEMAAQRAAIASAPTPEQLEAQAESDRLAAQAAVEARRPDLNEYRDAMAAVVDDLPQERLDWLRAQAESGREGAELALEWLYLEARVHRAGPVSAAAEAERKQRAASADRAKLSATTSSAEATPSRTPLSEAEKAGLAVKNRNRVAWGLDPIEE